ncbi:hypothetical protein Pint_33996 [Pistacia integerrima]|uniref:Uncharacterized protein n=1 Tax=Pistacia integerrima TaxID=434235 RepID=A0ACC0X2C6_9ROSI|nr:hypothetical protein Pint_33996 [Pistacia integerrima]
MSVIFQVVSANDYLELQVVIFPSVNGLLDKTNFSLIISQLINVSFVTLQPIFGPFYYNYNINYYQELIGEIDGVSSLSKCYAEKNSPNIGNIIGVKVASWDLNDPTSCPRINGVRCFSFEELKKCTNNFSNTNILGSGGFRQNCTLKDILLGIRLSWIWRLRIALDSVRGLAYLHELANPAIIHRDIKSNNILLDDHLIAKFVDFGLSKTLWGYENNQILTDVKGTPGANRPTMGEVVKEIENILQLADSNDL